MCRNEFFEGVRALLIDKDLNPKWAHKSVHEVSEAEINTFFNRKDSCNLDITRI